MSLFSSEDNSFRISCFGATSKCKGVFSSKQLEQSSSTEEQKAETIPELYT